jgi:F-type H+-transporting ATPase subunit delta
MPLIDAQPDAVARVYAQSLYDLANEQGGRAKVEEVLAELEDVLELAAGDAKLSELLASRAVSVEARSAVIGRIFNGRLTDLTVRFMQTLNKKGRLGHLPAVANAYDNVVQEKFGRVEVDVITAAPMSNGDLGSVREGLSRALGKDVVVHPYVEASMIGGVKFRIGDKLLDGSVATNLRNLKDRLDTQGASKLRSTIQRIIDDAGQ